MDHKVVVEVITPPQKLPSITVDGKLYYPPSLDREFEKKTPERLSHRQEVVNNETIHYKGNNGIPKGFKQIAWVNGASIYQSEKDKNDVFYTLNLPENCDNYLIVNALCECHNVHKNAVPGWNFAYKKGQLPPRMLSILYSYHSVNDRQNLFFWNEKSKQTNSFLISRPTTVSQVENLKTNWGFDKNSYK